MKLTARYVLTGVRLAGRSSIAGVEVWINPSPEQLVGSFNKMSRGNLFSSDKTLRYVVDGKDLITWDGHLAEHGQIALALGLIRRDTEFHNWGFRAGYIKQDEDGYLYSTNSLNRDKGVEVVDRLDSSLERYNDSLKKQREKENSPDLSFD